MVSTSRWKSAHDRFPAHVDDAKNNDGHVHRGYHLLEFRVAAELLRIGPFHSADDYWTRSDWQLLLVVSEYMSALLEFLDWFWPDLGWDHHKQAIVLSKRLLQPRSPATYPDLRIDPHLRAAWQSFTYCFWHGTRHLPAAPPPGDVPAAYTAARDWLTKLVGERGFEPEGHIVASLQSWIQATQPRLSEAFPAVDWSHWPSVVWPEPDCAFRSVEKRGALKRRQQEEDYAVRWPLRVTQGRPKFNHLKLEARDGFVVGIPSIKNPPALAFLPVSDVMCAFKQAAQHWAPAAPGSPAYAAQQDVVQSFVQNVLRETRGPLAPGIVHEKYKYLGYVACCALGWQSALLHLTKPLWETSTWGPQPLVLPGGNVALQLQQQQQLGTGNGGSQLFGLDRLAMPPNHIIGPGMGIDLGLSAQLALLPPLLPGGEAMGAPATQPPPQPVAAVGHHMQVAQQIQPQQLLPAGADVADSAAPGMAGTSNQVTTVQVMTPTAQESSRSSGSAPSAQPTRPRPSPFLARQAAKGAPPPPQQQQQPQQQLSELSASQHMLKTDADGQGTPQSAQQPSHHQTGTPNKAERTAYPEHLDGTGAVSLGGLSSMQDLLDQLPSHMDMSWSNMPGGAPGAEDHGAAAGTSAVGAQGASAAAQIAASLLLPPSWTSLQIPPLQIQQQALQGTQPCQQIHQPAPQQHVAQQQHQGPALQNTQPQNLQQNETLQGQLTGGPGLSAFFPNDSAFTLGSLQFSLGTFGRGGSVLGPPRSAPDAPVQVHPPSRAGSPYQATVTTGSLPGADLHSCLLRAEASSGEGRLARRSHGEVFTLSPVASVAPLGETLPCSPALADGTTAAGTAAAGAAAAAATAAEPPGCGRQSPDGRAQGNAATNADLAAAANPAGGGAVCPQRGRTGPQLLQTGSRRTRQDVADAAAEAAAVTGLPPAPGSLVERTAKRPNAQADLLESDHIRLPTAERVESLGAFLTDDLIGLGKQPPNRASAQSQEGRHHLAQQHHHVMRAQTSAPVSGSQGDAVPCPLTSQLLTHKSCGPTVQATHVAYDPGEQESTVPATVHRGQASVFATSAGSAAAAASVPEREVETAAAAESVQLQEQLAALLRRADQLAGRLAQADPAGAPDLVLRALQGSQFLYQCVMQGAGKQSQDT